MQTKLAQFGLVLHAVGGLAAFGICAGMYTFLYCTLDEDIRALRDQTNAKEQFLVSAQSVTSAQGDLQQRLADEERRLADVLKRIPRTPQESEFLAELAKLARREEGERLAPPPR